MGGIQRHNSNVRLDAIYALLNQRIPRDFKAISIGSGGGGGSRTVNISKVEVRVEYLGKSHEELVSTVRDRLSNELKSLLD